MNAAAPKRIPLRQIGNLKIFENAAFWNYRFIRFERSYEVDPPLSPRGGGSPRGAPLDPLRCTFTLFPAISLRIPRQSHKSHHIPASSPEAHGQLRIVRRTFTPRRASERP